MHDIRSSNFVRNILSCSRIWLCEENSNGTSPQQEESAQFLSAKAHSITKRWIHITMRYIMGVPNFFFKKEVGFVINLSVGSVTTHIRRKCTIHQINAFYPGKKNSQRCTLCWLTSLVNSPRDMTLKNEQPS